MNEAKRPHPQRMAAGSLLGVVGVGVLILLWMRGLLRPMMPVILIAVAVLIITRILKAITAPPPPE